MKTFLEYSSVKASDGAHVDEDGNLMDLTDDSVIEKLNAFVGSIGIKEYLNPEAAVNELRQKLMRVGINFGDVQFTGEEGEISVPLVKHGGVYGKDTDSAPEEVVNETEDTNEIIGTVAAGMGGLVAAAGGMAKLKMAAEDPAFKEKYPKIARMLSKLEDMGSAAGQAMRREREEMAEELNETKKALETVSKELNEVNLLNSKLLYVNRIFKANTLDEAQKLRVVETLDKAESVKEAKLIYETIKDTFTVAKSGKVSKRTKTTTLKENFGMASKAAGTYTAPKKEIISESNNMVNRFQKLANIQINE